MTNQTFTLPDLGEGLTEAEIVRWLVAVGDRIAVDQPVVEVETAKATVEVPSPFGGVIMARHGAEGEVVPVGTALIEVGPGLGTEAERYVTEERAGSGNVLVGYGTTQTARRRRTARRRTAPTSATPTTRPAVISPVVRKLARDNGVDLTRITGSAAGGVITRTDVERAISAEPAPAATAAKPLTDQASATGTTEPVSTPATFEGLAEGTSVAGDGGQAGTAARPQVAPAQVRQRIPLRGVRRAAAEAFTRSRREIPEATTWVDVDATALVELRQSINARTPDSPVKLLALIARIVVAGLVRHPELNSRVDVDAGEIVQYDTVNLGIAVQTKQGLVVPVIKNAQRLSARGLQSELDRARTGPLSPADLTGGTFTLNNYGVFGVDGSSPIINHPEAAILGIGRIIDRPWVVDGALAVRKVTQLSLAFDHRVCDGAPAAAFLRFVADNIEHAHQALADI